MSSKKSVQSLQIEPRLSRQLGLFMLLVHGAALLAIANTNMPVAIQLALAGFVLVNFIQTFQLHVLARAKQSVRMLVWDDHGDWYVFAADGEKLEARLLPASLVHPLLIVLNFRVKNRGRWTSILLADALDKRTHRQLLTRLRQEAK